MNVNKKALYALAAYYEACNSGLHQSESDLNLLIDMFIPTLKDSWDDKVLRRTFHHLELFFKFPTPQATYMFYISDREIAKVLRYIAKHEKFPPLRRLHYV